MNRLQGARMTRRDSLRDFLKRDRMVNPRFALVRYDPDFAAFQQRFTVAARRRRAAEQLAEWRRTNLDGQFRLTA